MTRPTTIRPGLDRLPSEVDVVVVGLGATGAGVALDAVTRGLSVLAVDAHDLAFGTSRWSSKLVHGGLRYLAHGQVGVAHESAVERGVLMTTTAPHLVRPMPYVVPLPPGAPLTQRAMLRSGLAAGDLLRRTARTPADALPRPRRLSATEVRALAPALGPTGGGWLGWDGQLVDDARLVVTLARTAAHHGAHVRTRARVVAARGSVPGGVVLRDGLTGREVAVTARAVVNAAGVWVGGLARDVRLRPSRGSHLVLRAAAVPGLTTAVFVPQAGSSSRYVMVLPQPDGTVYVGLTDEPVEGEVPDVPTPSDAEVDFLLSSLASAFGVAPTRADVVGSFAGLRPLLDADGATADLSRRHAVLNGPGGVTTVVGGKLTTYRRMAQDAVDAALAGTPSLAAGAGPCRTRRLPLLGAAPRVVLEALTDPPRLVGRYGTEAALVLDAARTTTGLDDDELLAPIAAGVPTTLAELAFGVSHEGAHDVGDLLDRRTRVGLVPADRGAALPAAERALRLAASIPTGRLSR